MRQALLLVVVAGVLIAGCVGGPATDAPGDATPTDSPVRGTASPTASASPTSSATATAEPTPVEYVVNPGTVPENVAAVHVIFRVVFVEHADDLGRCYPEVFEGPYQPTLTPIPTPSGECHTSDPVTVDLASLDGPTSLGTFMAPASTAGHALVVTDVSAEYDNGTAVRGIKGSGGVEVIRSPEAPSGAYGATLGVEAVSDDRPYDYWVLVDRFDPGNGTTTATP